MLGFVLLNQAVRLLKGICWAVKVLANHKTEPEQEPECQKGLCAFCGYRTVCADARENVRKCRMEQKDGEMQRSIKQLYPELAGQPLTTDIRRKMMTHRREVDRADARLLLGFATILVISTVAGIAACIAGFDVMDFVTILALDLMALGVIWILLHGIIKCILEAIRDR